MSNLEIVAIILAGVGLIGTFIPLLPGPGISFAAVVTLFFNNEANEVSVLNLVIFGICGLALVTFDYVSPILGAKFFGAGKQGIVGATVGGLLGFFLFPPLGIILGAFLGAILGEVSAGKTGLKAVKASIGTLLGSGVALILQVGYAIWILVWILFKIF